MCLSTVYKQNESENVFLFRNIARVEQNGGEIFFTDIMGVKRSFTGSIIDIDLIENTILVKGD